MFVVLVVQVVVMVVVIGDLYGFKGDTGVPTGETVREEGVP